MRANPRRYGCLLATLWLAGCATLFRAEPRPGPEDVAGRALAALARGEYRSAIGDLLWIRTHFPERPVGRYALLVLAGAEMDPDNPERRLHVGAEWLAEFRAFEDNPRWTVPVAGSLHRLALELGATQERALTTEGRLEQAERSSLEAAERASRAQRQAEAERGALERELAESRRALAAARSELAASQRQLAESRRELTRARQELERVRRALDGGRRPPGS